jgi:hypothetical protein
MCTEAIGSCRFQVDADGEQVCTQRAPVVPHLRSDGTGEPLMPLTAKPFDVKSIAC